MIPLKNIRKISSIICLSFSLVSLGYAFTFASSTTITVTVGAPPVCGDGIKEGGEGCDGSDLGGATCSSQGYTDGSLSCAVGCVLDTSSCFNSSPSQSTQTSSGGGGGATYFQFPHFVSDKIREKIFKIADNNGDRIIDIADLSILLYYANQKYNSRYDLNEDGLIDIVDVSILIYYWT